MRDHLPLLESRRFDKLARELGVSIEQIAEATKVIAVLEPKPGRDYGDGETRYVTPDVYIQKVGDECVVTLNDEGLPRLRVSPFYRRMLGAAKGSPEAKRLHPGEDAGGGVAHQVDPPAPAHALHGHARAS